MTKFVIFFTISTLLCLTGCKEVDQRPHVSVGSGYFNIFNAGEKVRDADRAKLTILKNAVGDGIMRLDCNADAQLADLAAPISILAGYGIGKYEIVYKERGIRFFIPGYPATTLNQRTDNPPSIYNLTDVISENFKAPHRKFSRVVAPDTSITFDELVKCVDAFDELSFLLIAGEDDAALWMYFGPASEWFQ